MNKRPIIAVTGSYDSDEQQYYVKKSYMEAIWMNGGVPIILEPKIETPEEWLGDREELVRRVEIHEEILDVVDGILFTGGEDVDPQFIGDEVLMVNGTIVPNRDAWEMALVRIAHERDIPSLGICRGIQSMAAALGVKLTQDIHAEGIKTPNQHRQKAPSWYPIHQVHTEEESKLRQILGEDCWVNSFHHQALADGQEFPFAITAHATDGTIEGMEDKNKTFFVGVQWHPERMMNNPLQRGLFKGLIDAAASKME